MSISNYLENAILNHVLNNTAYTTPGASLYCGVHTASPTDVTATALANEITGNGYAREVLSFGAAASGTSATDTDTEFGAATGGNWGTLTHTTIWDASTSGNLLFWGTLSPNVVINDTDVFRILTGALTVTLD